MQLFSMRVIYAKLLFIACLGIVLYFITDAAVC